MVTGVGLPAQAPTNTAAPVVTDSTVAGRFQYADVLTATDGTWTVGGTATPCGPSTGMVCAYQWQRSSDGGSTWSNITTGDCRVICRPTYRVQTGDEGDRLRVIVTAGDATGSADGISTATATAVAPTCNFTDSTATSLNADYQNATAGQTICLNSGAYAWNPTVARSAGTNVLVMPAAGASVTMTLNANPASYVTIAGVTFTGGSFLQNTTNHLTVYDYVVQGFGNSYFVLITDSFNQNAVFLDDGVLNNQHALCTGGPPPTTCSTGGAARIWLTYNSTDTTNTIGVTISNNLFGGTEGELTPITPQGGAGVQILANEFTGVDGNGQGTGSTCGTPTNCQNIYHADTIFAFPQGGGTGTHMVMEYNWFHDNINVPTCGWAQWDGGQNNTFDYNVISQSGGTTGPNGCLQSGPTVLYDGNGNAANASIVQHNVIEPGVSSINHSQPIGQILLGGKTAQGAGAGTIIRDDSYASVANGDGGLNSTFTEDHNLCVTSCTTTGGSGGSGDIIGSPTWAGGTAPSSYEGFALASGSGIGAASDGTNIGIPLPTNYPYPR